MTRCDHDAATHDYQSFNELDGTLSVHTACDACCETLGATIRPAGEVTA